MSITASRKDNQQSEAVVGQTIIPVDEDGIPFKPAYSIKTFLSGLPTPVISDDQFLHLYRLAALIPPSPGTPKFRQKKQALEEMVRLVEGVRPDSKDQASAKLDRIPDGRIWPENEGTHIDWESIIKSRKTRKSASLEVDSSPEDQHIEGKAILDLAAKQVAGYYVVKKRQTVDVE